MPPRRERQEQVTPTLLEYSFESCPEEELSSCCQYEYLASSPLIRKTVESWRAGKQDASTKAVALLFGPDIFWALKGNSWPKCPYLDTPEAKLQPQGQSSRRQRNLAHLVTPWTHLYDAASVERVVPIYLPPSVPLSKLKKAFADLLLRDYPHLLLKEPGWRIQKRGRGSLTEQYRAGLKALSAWRLHKQFGHSAREAIALLRTHKLSTYADQRAFYRAVNRAARKIATLEKQLRQFAKNMTA